MFTWGETRSLLDDAMRKNFPCVVPSPSKLSSSPVGSRTSTPSDNQVPAARRKLYFVLTTTSPMPVAEPDSRNVLGDVLPLDEGVDERIVCASRGAESWRGRPRRGTRG